MKTHHRITFRKNYQYQGKYVFEFNKQFHGLYFYSIPSTIILKIKHWKSFEVRQVTDIFTKFTPGF